MKGETVKFGVIPVNVGVANVDSMIALGVKAEEVGVESVWTFEHVVVPLDYQSAYPYDKSGKMGATPETNFVDPLIALSALSTATSKIRFGTGVNILPQANPLYVAKQAASLDFVSKGRFMLGVGIGWLREEYAALGVPFERRGARFDDYIVAIKKIWSGETVEHESEYIDWSGFKSYPVPVQKPHVPIIIGGSKGKAFERVALHGDGWYAPTATVEQLEPLMKELAAACEAVGRDPGSVEVTCMWMGASAWLDVVERYAELGVSRLLCPVPLLGGGNPVDAVARFGDEVIAAVG
jgi:probable F420-dependent oxidoreductase